MAALSVSAVQRQLRPRSRPVWAILFAMVGVTAVSTGFLMLGTVVGEGFGYFSKEPAETLRVPRYIGWQAYIVVLIEAAGTVSALFAGSVVRRHRGPGVESGFLLGAGSLSALLLLDDLFQLHDHVYARLFGIQEIVVYPVYVLLAAMVAWRWGRHVARTDVSLVLLAGVWLAVSVGIDQVAAKTWPYFHLAEDGAKMMGLTLWAVFLVRTAMRLTSDCVQTSAPPARFEVPAAAPAPQHVAWIPQPADLEETTMLRAVTFAATSAAGTPARPPAPRSAFSSVPSPALGTDGSALLHGRPRTCSSRRR